MFYALAFDLESLLTFEVWRNSIENFVRYFVHSQDLIISPFSPSEGLCQTGGFYVEALLRDEDRRDWVVLLKLGRMSTRRTRGWWRTEQHFLHPIVSSWTWLHIISKERRLSEQCIFRLCGIKSSWSAGEVSSWEKCKWPGRDGRVRSPSSLQSPPVYANEMEANVMTVGK